MTTYWCERAWLGDEGFVDGVVVEVEGTHISAVCRGEPPLGAESLAGLTIPGFANSHSHAFHRALRGRTQRERGSFWTWRDTMYDVAGCLDPDTYHALALATYQEMALAGITVVGEFHYLHHDPSGSPYADPNAMGEALVAAAREAGLRITLLDTCYLSSGFGTPAEGVQRRFSDRDADRWATRVEALAFDDPGVVVGAAIHSVRAVPRDQLATVASALPGRPLHIHLSEQRAENAACLDAYGLTPTGLIADAGVLSDRLAVVHATHLTDSDILTLAGAQVYAGFCPTTERDLADGVGPARELVDAGARLTLGSDSHAVVDMHEEMRAVELHTRLQTQLRGHFRAAELIAAATSNGHASLGFPDGGCIAAGAWADLVTVDRASLRTAGTGSAEETVVFAATAADIVSVIASGERVVLDPAEVADRLATSIGVVVS